MPSTAAHWCWCVNEREGVKATGDRRHAQDDKERSKVTSFY